MRDVPEHLRGFIKGYVACLREQTPAVGWAFDHYISDLDTRVHYTISALADVPDTDSKDLDVERFDIALKGLKALMTATSFQISANCKTLYLRVEPELSTERLFDHKASRATIHMRGTMVDVEMNSGPAEIRMMSEAASE